MVEYEDYDSAFYRDMQSQYLSNVDERIHLLQASIASLRTDPENHAYINDAFLIAHKLRGTAGTYGLFPASEIGDKMELILRAALEGNLTLTREHLDFFELLVAKLLEYFQLALKGDIHAKMDIPAFPSSSTGKTATSKSNPDL